MNKTVAIFGGSNEGTYKKIGCKHGVDILFHCGKTRNGSNKKIFKSIIEKADVVVVLFGALGHVSMDTVKEVSKQLGKEVIYHKGFGASGAVQQCVEYFNHAAA